MTKRKTTDVNARFEGVKKISKGSQKTFGNWFGCIKETSQQVVSDVLERIDTSKMKKDQPTKYSGLPTKITPGMVKGFINRKRLFQESKVDEDRLKAVDEIVLSYHQKKELKILINAATTSQSVISRAKIILDLADGKSKYQIKKEYGCAYTTINRWEKRWIWLQSNLAPIEEKGSAKALREALQLILNDSERSGAPPTFTDEEVVQIIALACTSPSEVGVEVSHWSVRLLAQAAVNLGIVQSISPSQIAVFFSPQTLNRIVAPTG